MVSTMTFYLVLVVTVLASVATHSSEVTSELRMQSREHRQGPGGEEWQDPHDPKYKKLAEESYRKYQKTHFDGDYIRKVILKRVTRQVVNGYMYRLDFIVILTAYTGDKHTLVCNSKVWEMTDDGPKEISVDCYIPNEGRGRKKRQIPGGEQVQDPKDPEYKTLAEESYQKYLDSDSSSIPRKAKYIVVTNATSQVVSGFITRIRFFVTTIYDEILLCNSKVWEQSWLKKKDITVNCHKVSLPN